MCPRYNYSRSTSYRTLAWLGVKEKGRLIIVEDLLIISVLDSIESDLNARLMPVVAWWRHAVSTRRVRNHSLDSQLQIQEGTECVVGVVDLVEVVLEGIKVTTLEHNAGAAHLGTVVWHQLFDRGPIVEVVEQGITRVLLAVQGDGEWNGLLNDI